MFLEVSGFHLIYHRCLETFHFIDTSISIVFVKIVGVNALVLRGLSDDFGKSFYVVHALLEMIKRRNGRIGGTQEVKTLEIPLRK